MSMIRDFLEMPNDSMKKTIIVATLLCLVCSVLVSGAAVALKPIQDYAAYEFLLKSNQLYLETYEKLLDIGKYEPSEYSEIASSERVFSLGENLKKVLNI